MAFDRTAAEAILKNLYRGPVRDQLNQSSALLAEVPKKEGNVVGLQVVLPLRTARAEAVGARAEGGTLPTARNQGYTTATFGVKYLYARIELSGPVIESTKSDEGAFLRALDSETRGALSEAKEDLARQLSSNDVAGRGSLASCGTTTASTTVQLAGTNVSTWRKLRIGMYIDIIDNDDDSVLASNRQITAVDTSAATITVSGAAVTTDSTHRVCRTGNWKHEVIGIPGIVSDTGSLHNVNPSTYPVWKASVLANGGTARALSEDLLQQALDTVEIASGEQPDAFLTEHTQRRKYVALLTSMKRAVNTQELRGGYTAVTFNDNIPLIVDRFMNPSEIQVLNRQHLSIERMADWDWADRDGAVLRAVSGQDSWEAFLFQYGEFSCDKRNAFGVIQDLAV